MSYYTLSGYGLDEANANQGDVTGYGHGDDEIRIQISNPRQENGYSVECSECGQAIDEYPNGWEGHADDCDRAGQGPEPSPDAWLNSAAITIDPSENAVTCSISVGDPRGAFTFTVRQLADGRMVMHVPTPTGSMNHRELEPMHDGTYLIK